jgi:Uma2 family endonuclease
MSSVTTAIPIAPATLTPTQPSAPQSPELYRFNVDEYERMVLDDPRVELINGYVVKKMPKKPTHRSTTKRVLKSLDGLLPPGWTSQKEDPVRIPDFDEPEPDVATVRGCDDDYEQRHPGPGDVGLLVEVSDTTLDRDRNEKLPVYARAGIPVSWIVNLVDRQVEVYTDPGPDGYRSSQVYKPGQTVPVVIGGRQVGQMAVDDILR